MITLLQLLIVVATQAVVNGVEQVTEAVGAMVEDGVVVDKGILFYTWHFPFSSGSSIWWLKWKEQI